MVDTGTVQNAFPKEQADPFNALFYPPAVYNETLVVHVAQCNATATDLGVQIGGKVFGFSRLEMILSTGVDDEGCFSVVQAGTNAPGFPHILGSVFLRNVLAVFDVGKTQMTFSSRMYYAK